MNVSGGTRAGQRWKKNFARQQGHHPGNLYKRTAPLCEEEVVLQYSCDFCGRLKNPRETWLLGVAAEAVSPTSAHRTVSMAAAWDEDRAVDQLAVHFCSVKCKENYIKSLFNREPAEGEVVEEETIELLPAARRRTSRKAPRHSTQSGARKKKRAA
jgi:hypothetical protein